MITNIICSEKNIYFECDSYNVNLTAEGDCCSTSWFKYNKKLIKSCIGKTYIKCVLTDRYINLKYSGIQEYDRNHIYELHFKDGTIIDIILRNSSNGYYDGHINEEITFSDSEIITKKNALIILIGLPGSGKTTYGKMLEESIKNSVLYDDIEMVNSTINRIKQDLILGKKVIVTNPRFCIATSYYDFINRLNLCDVNHSIVTYCFIPDINSSIYNIKQRESYNKKKMNAFIESIHNYSKHYTTDFISHAYRYNCKKIQTYKK